MELTHEYQAYLAFIGPPALMLLAGGVAAVYRHRVIGLLTMAGAAVFIALIFATSQDGYCFEPTVEACGAFWWFGFLGWPISITAIALTGSIVLRARRGRSAAK
jgi:hypothetical protein